MCCPKRGAAVWCNGGHAKENAKNTNDHHNTKHRTQAQNSGAGVCVLRCVCVALCVPVLQPFFVECSEQQKKRHFEFFIILIMNETCHTMF